jgi:hypothetical protein
MQESHWSNLHYVETICFGHPSCLPGVVESQIFPGSENADSASMAGEFWT